MVSLLHRYNWTSFSIVTSSVAGAAEFVSSLEALEAKSREKNVQSSARLEILSVVNILSNDNVTETLRDLRGTDTRIFLLHCSR
ncbi:glutamate receptor ionotropic, NMDA 2D-like protein [Elysia marginata]|uniref:Glutamate receptor ionotropic, NMDA 2D-like protein n=1 Tax=Elysia marginata TaxID=1093978 RepID=A0AAV4F6Q1_9GAST|nr:glutamate receptor ionotropic, NMDA 2D-like protein [Elysia marginata]